MTNWRGFGIAAVIAIGVWLLFVQVTGGDRQEATPVSTVEPVPEDLLDSVRNLFMATPQNIDCLSGELLLSCIYSDNTMQQIGALENMSDLFLLGPIDVSKLPLAPLPVPTTDAAPATAQ